MGSRADHVRRENPLFRPDALRLKLPGFALPPAAPAPRPQLAAWANLLGASQARQEEGNRTAPRLHRRRVRGPARLRPPAGRPVHPQARSARRGGRQVRRRRARAVRRGAATRSSPCSKAKAARPARPPFAGRKPPPSTRPRYAVNSDRLVSRHQPEGNPPLPQGPRHASLTSGSRRRRLAADDAEFRRFVFLLGAERSSPRRANHLDELLAESKQIGRELTNDFYREYRDLRAQTFEPSGEHNPAATRRSCSPRRRRSSTACCSSPSARTASCCPATSSPGPSSTPTRSTRGRSGTTSRPVPVPWTWATRAGRRRYNGGLFAADAVPRRPDGPRRVCEGFKKLADYEYGTDADDADGEADRRGDPRPHLRAVDHRPRRAAPRSCRRRRTPHRPGPGRRSGRRKGRSTRPRSSPATSSPRRSGRSCATGSRRSGPSTRRTPRRPRRRSLADPRRSTRPS